MDHRCHTPLIATPGCNKVSFMIRTLSAPKAQLTGIKAVLFDAYGTLFDVYSVALLAEQLFPGQGQSLSVLWRDKQIEYSRLLTASRKGPQREPLYQPFWEITRAGLRYACKRLQLNLSSGLEERLMNQYRHLSAFPETARCCRPCAIVACAPEFCPTAIRPCSMWPSSRPGWARCWTT